MSENSSNPRSDDSRNLSHLSASALQAKLPSVDDFVLLKPITKGGFGKVYLGTKRKYIEEIKNRHALLQNGENKENIPPPPTYFAIKILKKEELDQKNMLNSVVTERKALALSRSTHTVHLYYSMLTESEVVLVMEYMIGGDLGALLEIKQVFDYNETAFYISQIVLALEYLHKY